jgi:hypothetical protein
MVFLIPMINASIVQNQVIMRQVYLTFISIENMGQLVYRHTFSVTTDSNSPLPL